MRNEYNSEKRKRKREKRNARNRARKVGGIRSSKA